MPVTSSAIKKDRQDKKARARNRVIRNDYKKASKEVRKFIKAGDQKKATAALESAFSKIDKAAKKNVIHKNNASRRKSRLSKLVLKSFNKKPKETSSKK